MRLTHGPDPLLHLGRQLLVAIGEDPDREGLQGTPARWAKWWREFTGWEAGNLATSFTAQDTVDELVVVSGLPLWSLCEHHLLPFSVEVAVGYVADGTVLGLSKLARVAQKHAHRLQLQERLVAGIATEVAGLVGHQNVGVIGKGRHLCMEMRGVRTPGLFTTSALLGSLRSDARQRAEFLHLAG